MQKPNTEQIILDLQKNLETIQGELQDLKTQHELHNHSGVGTRQLEPRNALAGFPIVAAAPTDLAPEGTIRLFYDGADYKIYCRINKGWRVVALT